MSDELSDDDDEFPPLHITFVHSKSKPRDDIKETTRPRDIASILFGNNVRATTSHCTDENPFLTMVQTAESEVPLQDDGEDDILEYEEAKVSFAEPINTATVETRSRNPVTSNESNNADTDTITKKMKSLFSYPLSHATNPSKDTSAPSTTDRCAKKIILESPSTSTSANSHAPKLVKEAGIDKYSYSISAESLERIKAAKLKKNEEAKSRPPQVKLKSNARVLNISGKVDVPTQSTSDSDISSHATDQSQMKKSANHQVSTLR